MVLHRFADQLPSIRDDFATSLNEMLELISGKLPSRPPSDLVGMRVALTIYTPVCYIHRVHGSPDDKKAVASK